MSKFEARNPKFETILNDRKHRVPNNSIRIWVLDFGIPNFEIVSDFDIGFKT